MARSDPRNLRAKWQRALEERRKAAADAPPLDVTPRPTRAGKGDDAPVERAPASDSPSAHVPSDDAPVERAPVERAPAPKTDAPAARAPEAEDRPKKPAPPRSGAASQDDEDKPK